MKWVNWGLIDYAAATDRQLTIVDSVRAGMSEEVIALCSHPSVVTLGRATAPGDVGEWTGATVETSRGGRATYHGPNQIIVYPILDLTRKRKHLASRDVHAYLRALETATVTTLHELGLFKAVARTAKVDGMSLTGVWIGERKIASLGIAVRRWVSYHGVAINVLADASAFRGIRPCGFSPDIMTSIEEETDQMVNLDSVQGVCARMFTSYLG